MFVLKKQRKSSWNNRNEALERLSRRVLEWDEILLRKKKTLASGNLTPSQKRSVYQTRPKKGWSYEVLSGECDVIARAEYLKISSP